MSKSWEIIRGCEFYDARIVASCLPIIRDAAKRIREAASLQAARERGRADAVTE
jgi:hypothetical protein